MPKKFIHQMLLSGLLVSVSGISVSQIYLPSANVGRSPPTAFDPDILRTITDERAGDTFRRPRNCGTNCNGIIHIRLGNAQIVLPESQETPSSPSLMFDYQIRVGQDATPDHQNYLQSLGIYIVYGLKAFGEDWFTNNHCTAEKDSDFTRKTGVGVAARQTIGDLGDSLVGGNLFNAGLGLDGPDENSFVFPYDSEEQMSSKVMTVKCRIRERRAPANVAVQGRTIDQNQQYNQVQYVPVAENNLWYYPLDGNPAIIDVEASGGGDHFYIDVTFSEGVANRNRGAVGVNEFADAVTFVPRTAAYDDARSSTLTLARVTRPGGDAVKAGDRVIRLQFTEYPSTEVATLVDDGVITDPNILLSVEPPAGVIFASDDGMPMHRGEEWWVRAWYDHRAPRITTAEVDDGNAYVDVTFKPAVKFEVMFNDENQASMTSTRKPEREDFVIRHWHYDDPDDPDDPNDPFTDYPPAMIQDFAGTEIIATPEMGLTELRLVLPKEIRGNYKAGDTLDIRTAQRQKNVEYPSLASVFIYGDSNLGAPDDGKNAEFRKNGKFATKVGNTNFPRTAAFAQVGSLPLNRTLEVTFESDDEEDLVIDGKAVEIKVGLFGTSEEEMLAEGEIVIVDIAWQGGTPPDPNVVFTGETRTTLTSGQPDGSFMVRAGVGAAKDSTGKLVIKAFYGKDDNGDDDAVAGVTVIADDTLDVRVIDEIQVNLVFGDPDGAPVSEATVEIGGRTEVAMSLSGDATNLGEGVTLMLAISSDGAGVTGVTVDPNEITFTSIGSTQRVAIEADLSAITHLSGVMLTASATNQPHLTTLDPPVRFIEPDPPFSVKVIPSFAFADVEPDAFAALITDSAPGATSVRVMDDDVTIVPGTGGRMKLDLYAPVDPLMTTGNVYVCVKEATSEHSACQDANDFRLLAESNTTAARTAEGTIIEAVRTTEVGNFMNVVHWAAVDGSELDLLEEPKKVYVAPPVGFRTGAIAYSSPVSDIVYSVDTDLAAATAVTGVTIKISGESTTLMTLGPVSLGAYSINYTMDKLPPDALEIEELNGVTFDVRRFLDPSDSVGTLIRDKRLLSIGNARVELRESNLAPSLSFGLETFGKVGEISSTTGSFKGGFLITSPSADQDAELEVTVAAYEFKSTSFELVATTVLEGVERESGHLFAVRWGNFEARVDALPANSFIEIKAVAGSDESRFRMLVTEAGTGPTGKTPVPGVYAQAEGDGDLRLQSNLGIIGPLGNIEVPDIVLGVFDYLIANLRPGEVVSVRLELLAEVSEDEVGFVLYKYTEAHDWLPFMETDFDKVYSARAPCPSREASRGKIGDEDTAWRLASPENKGVQIGHKCLLLQVQEGGENDADRTANGVLHDPPALALPGLLDPLGGGGGGGGGAMEPAWLILLAGGMLLSAGLRRRRRPAPSA